MRRCGLKILLMWSYILLWTACGNGEWEENIPDNKDCASLILTFNSAESGEAATRGIEDLNDDGNVSEEELCVDGRKMYRLGVFLAESNGKVVASTVLEANDTRFIDNNTKAKVNFVNLEYHKTYTLYAVANYGNYGTLTGNLSNISAENVAGTNQVTASTDKLCNPSTSYPLSLKKEIKLEPGLNTITGTLLRTYARLRISLRNQSALKDLKINELSFPTNFTQSSANLFTEGGTANAKPIATSTDAITPFKANTVIPKIDTNGNVTETTLFDSYLLESNGGNYNYTLKLSFEDDAQTTYSVSNKAIGDKNNVKHEKMYVIYNIKTKTYLYANGSKVEAGTSYLTNGVINPNYVWRFEKPSAYVNFPSYFYFHIKSMGTTGYYMQSTKVTNSQVPLIVTPSSSDYFTIDTEKNQLRFRSRTNSNYFISVNGNNVCGHNTNSNQDLRNFYLYEVTMTQGSGGNIITHNETIPINIVDKTTGEPNPLKAIKRNDFINILINVTYNEKTGQVTFEVSDWEEINGEVTFD